LWPRLAKAFVEGTPGGGLSRFDGSGFCVDS
jgi:hypothetical protein